MAILLIRTVILYFLTLLAVTAMGKRQLGQLQPFEFVVILMISDMASLAMQSTNAALANSVIPIAMLTVLQIILALVGMKHEKWRQFFCGKPMVIIENGRLRQDNLTKLRLNLNDVQELCRLQGYFDLSAIQQAVMETNGQLSLLPKTGSRPVELGDIQPESRQETVPHLLIMDGHIHDSALRELGYDGNWLNRKLSSYHLEPEALFIAGVDSAGRFFWQKKDGRTEDE